MFESINKGLTAVLDKLGTKWKSTAGLLAVIGLQIAQAYGYVTPEQFNQWYEWAWTFFGIGMLHKGLKAK